MPKQTVQLESIVLDEDNDFTCTLHSKVQAFTQLKVGGGHYLYLCRECAEKMYEGNKQEIEGQRGPKH